MRLLATAIVGAALLACPQATPNDDDKPTTGKIPAGAFMMGCNDAADSDCEQREFPYHEVTLGDFEIDKLEVTVADYRLCFDDGACTEPNTCDNYCNWNASGRDAHPINGVSWFQAQAYCAWAGKRLCTEAEWEKAARGDDGRVFPWGNETPSCDRAVMDDGGGWGCGRNTTAAVGSKSSGRSPYGMSDMAGNVWEWVADFYEANAYQSCASGCTDPTGPGSGQYRVLRGGCWVNTPSVNLRTSTRAGFSPTYADDGIGFRCCL